MKANRLYISLISALCIYLLSYAVARVAIFQSVEHYQDQETLGVEAKGNPRQDYIAKVDRSPGEGWEYQLFLPVIKVEEKIVNFFLNL